MNCPVQIPATPKHVEVQVLKMPQHCRPLQGPLVHFPFSLGHSEQLGDRLLVQVSPGSTEDPLTLSGVPDSTLELNGAALKGSTPRALPQSAPFEVQSSGRGINV